MNQVENSYTCTSDELHILARHWLREIWTIRYLYRANGSCEYHDLNYAKSRVAALEVPLGGAISTIDDEVAEEFAIVRDYYELKAELTDIGDCQRFPRLSDSEPQPNRVFEISESTFAKLQQHPATYSTDSTSFVSVETACNATGPYCCLCWSSGTLFYLRRLAPPQAEKLHRLVSLRLVSCPATTECPVCGRTMDKNSIVVRYFTEICCSHGCAEVVHRQFNDSTLETQQRIQ